MVPGTAWHCRCYSSPWTYCRQAPRARQRQEHLQAPERGRTPLRMPRRARAISRRCVSRRTHQAACVAPRTVRPNPDSMAATISSNAQGLARKRKTSASSTARFSVAGSTLPVNRIRIVSGTLSRSRRRKLTPSKSLHPLIAEHDSIGALFVNSR